MNKFESAACEQVSVPIVTIVAILATGSNLLIFNIACIVLVSLNFQKSDYLMIEQLSCLPQLSAKDFCSSKLITKAVTCLEIISLAVSSTLVSENTLAVISLIIVMVEFVSGKMILMNKKFSPETEAIFHASVFHISSLSRFITVTTIGVAYVLLDVYAGEDLSSWSVAAMIALYLLEEDASLLFNARILEIKTDVMSSEVVKNSVIICTRYRWRIIRVVIPSFAILIALNMFIESVVLIGLLSITLFVVSGLIIFVNIDAAITHLSNEITGGTKME